MWRIFMSTLGAICFFALAGFGVNIDDIIDNEFSTSYHIKRCFGPSSVKNLAKMSQIEKDKQLSFYARQEFQKGSLAFCTFPVFTPRAKCFNEIIYLIEHGAFVNLDIPYYWAHKVSGSGTFKPIYLFIKANDIERTKKLLERGATVGEVIQSKGWSRTTLSFVQTVEMAQLLIDHGAVILYEQDWLHAVVAASEYAPELIPFYLSHYEGDKLAFAQAIWQELQEKKWHYRSPERRQQFYKKKQYLKDAGVEIDTQWDD